MQKRGISEVVAVAMLILFVIVLIVLLYLFVLPFIREEIEFDDECYGLRIVTSDGYTVVDYDVGGYADNLMVQVGQGDESEDLVGITFIFGYDYQGSFYDEPVDNETLPGMNSKKVYKFRSFMKGVPVKVSIVPLFKDGHIGPICSVAKFKEGAIPELENPMSILGGCKGADINGDGIVDERDFDYLSGAGSCYCPLSPPECNLDEIHPDFDPTFDCNYADINGDGKVDGADSAIWQRAYYSTCEST